MPNCKIRLSRRGLLVIFACAFSILHASCAYGAEDRTDRTSKAANKATNVNVVLTDHGIRPHTVRAREHHTVHLHVTNAGNLVHQFSIPDFYIYSRTLQPGESSDISFAPYKFGRFQMTSDPTGDNTPEFRGQFIVKDTR